MASPLRAKFGPDRRRRVGIGTPKYSKFRRNSGIVVDCSSMKGDKINRFRRNLARKRSSWMYSSMLNLVVTSEGRVVQAPAKILFGGPCDFCIGGLMYPPLPSAITNKFGVQGPTKTRRLYTPIKRFPVLYTPY